MLMIETKNAKYELEGQFGTFAVTRTDGGRRSLIAEVRSPGLGRPWFVEAHLCKLDRTSYPTYMAATDAAIASHEAHLREIEEAQREAARS